jgi:hypothetical protein
MRKTRRLRRRRKTRGGSIGYGMSFTKNYLQGTQIGLVQVVVSPRGASSPCLP